MSGHLEVAVGFALELVVVAFLVVVVLVWVVVLRQCLAIHPQGGTMHTFKVVAGLEVVVVLEALVVDVFEVDDVRETVVEEVKIDELGEVLKLEEEDDTGGLAPQAPIALVSRVIADPAYKPPWTDAPVVTVMAVEARMLPAKTVAVPIVAAVPTIQ